MLFRRCIQFEDSLPRECWGSLSCLVILCFKALLPLLLSVNVYHLFNSAIDSCGSDLLTWGVERMNRSEHGQQTEGDRWGQYSACGQRIRSGCGSPRLKSLIGQAATKEESKESCRGFQQCWENPSDLVGSFIFQPNQRICCREAKYCSVLHIIPVL